MKDKFNTKESVINDSPLISIITPTYNRAKFIAESIESVLNQTYKNYELLIVDDGSTDNTKELLENYKDTRIKYQYQTNQGQSIARNLGLQAATGDYVCFLDSDNLWFPDKLTKSLEAFEEHPDVDIVYGDCVTINEEGKEISRKNMKRHSGYIAPLMLIDNFVSMNTTMTKRRCFQELGGLSGKRRVADDYDLWLRFSSKYKYLYLPEYLAFYRVMEDQISSDKMKRFDSNEAIILDFIEDYPDAVSKEQKKYGLSRFYIRKARYFAGIGERVIAFKALGRAMHYNIIPKYLFKVLFRIIFPDQLKS